MLTSIKRTEDSLMRLKRSRKQLGQGTGTQNTQEGQPVMSDDDKIRVQFTHDTEEFGRAVSRKLSWHLLFLPRPGWLFANPLTFAGEIVVVVVLSFFRSKRWVLAKTESLLTQS